MEGEKPAENVASAFLEFDILIEPRRAAEIADVLRQSLDTTDLTDSALDTFRERDPELAEYFEEHTFDEARLPEALEQTIYQDERVRGLATTVTPLLQIENTEGGDATIVGRLRERIWLEHQRVLYAQYGVAAEASPPSVITKELLDSNPETYRQQLIALLDILPSNRFIAFAGAKIDETEEREAHSGQADALVKFCLSEIGEKVVQPQIQRIKSSPSTLSPGAQARVKKLEEDPMIDPRERHDRLVAIAWIEYLLEQAHPQEETPVPNNNHRWAS